MKKHLIYKELKLFIPFGIYLFSLLSLLLLVPNYPACVPLCYGILAVFIMFNISRGNKDLEFTSTLPIPRNDIVWSKHFSIIFLELLQIVVAIPCAIIADLILYPSGNLVGMDANFAFFGITLISFSVFNIIFLPLFFKSGYKTGFPALFGSLGYIITTMVFEVLIGFIPALKNNLDSLAVETFGYQMILLGLGIIVFITTTILSYKLSVKNFNKVSL